MLVSDGAFFLSFCCELQTEQLCRLLELVHAFAGLGHKLPKGTHEIILLVLCQGVSVPFSV